MKRHFALFTKGVIAFGIMLSCTVTGSIASAAPRTQMHNGTLVALGDSITFGYNLDDTHNNSVPSMDAFPYLMGHADHLRVSDLGIPGWTSGDLLSALRSPNFSRAIHGASAITIDIGSNDLLQWAAANGLLSVAPGSTPPTLTLQQQIEVQNILAQFAKNFAQSISLIRSESSSPIVAYTLYDPFPMQSPLHPLDEQLEAVENATIMQVAASNKDVVVADAHSAFNGNQLTDVRLAQGDVHPTTTGQIVLAQIGEQALQSSLANLMSPNLSSGVTHLLVGSLPHSGGEVAGTLNNSSVRLVVPAGSLNHSTEADITSQELTFPKRFERFAYLKHFLVAEDAVNFMSSVSFGSPYSLTITNPAIPKNAVVYEILGDRMTKVESATVKRGQVTISAARSGDFIVLALPSRMMER